MIEASLFRWERSKIIRNEFRASEEISPRQSYNIYFYNLLEKIIKKNGSLLASWIVFAPQARGLGADHVCFAIAISFLIHTHATHIQTGYLLDIVAVTSIGYVRTRQSFRVSHFRIMFITPVILGLSGIRTHSNLAKVGWDANALQLRHTRMS